MVMGKIVICYKCGFNYNRYEEAHCPRCNDSNIFIPQRDDPNYDLYSDVSRFSRMRILYMMAIVVVFAIVMIILGK